MPESSSKGSKKNGKLSSSDTIVQLTQNQLEELIKNVILKATKPLKDEIAALKNVVGQLHDSLSLSAITTMIYQKIIKT